MDAINPGGFYSSRIKLLGEFTFAESGNGGNSSVVRCSIFWMINWIFELPLPKLNAMEIFLLLFKHSLVSLAQRKAHGLRISMCRVFSPKGTLTHQLVLAGYW